MSTTDIQRTERDGVPVLWLADDRTPRATLVFRAGRVDERTGDLGAHHLIEHLVLDDLGDVAYEINGTAGPLTTTFHAVGSPAELRSFLSAVGQRLASLPIAQLAAQRRVLSLEQLERMEQGSVKDELVAFRWGGTPLGLLGQPEAGLLTLAIADLEAYASRSFTRGNAVLCWSGAEPPVDLCIPLPAGTRRELPGGIGEPVTPLPLGLHADADEVPGLAISAVVPDDAEHLLACGVIRERLERCIRGEHAAAYGVNLSWDDLLPGAAHVTWGGPLDGRSASRAGGAAIEAFLADWPATEVQVEIDRVRRTLLDELVGPSARHTVLVEEAQRHLVGEPVRTIADRQAAIDAVGVDAVDRARRSIRATAIAYVPQGVGVPRPPFHELPDEPPLDLTHATVFESKGLRRSARVRLAITDEGFQLDIPNHSSGTVRFAEIVSAVRTLDRTWEVLTRTAATSTIALDAFKDPDAVDALLEGHIPADVRDRALGSQQTEAVAARTEADLSAKQRKRLGDELGILPAVLEPDERLLRLSEGMRGMKSGLIAVTDERTLHFFIGELSTEVLHTDLRGLRIEHPMTGVRLVLETRDEAVALAGDTRSAEFVAIRDLIDEHR